MKAARLVLATGEQFSGYVPAWQQDTTFGEVIFNTGMVGYVEAMTDPSYAGQILTFTYPLMGNYGVPNVSQWESSRIQTRAIIVSEAAPFFARSHAEQSLLAWCENEKVPLMTGVDTRALTLCLRERGVVSGAILVEGMALPSKFEDVNQLDLVKMVTRPAPLTVGSGDRHIIAIDCGMKENILRCLRQFDWKITCVPYDYDFSHLHYDGVFISNGPGDPKMCSQTIAIIQKVLQQNKPTFGICLGAQLMALAIGAKTYKLQFGHRSQNQPCLEIASGRCYLTSQNHGFAIDAQTLPSDWQVTFRNLNDDTVQGIEHRTSPFFAVQFHPEACPGPWDTLFLFKKFYETCTQPYAKAC